MDDGLCIETNINRQSIIISFSELWVLYIYDRDRERERPNLPHESEMTVDIHVEGGS